MAAFLGLFGLVLSVVGVLMIARGDYAGVLGLALGALILCGAAIFVRAAVRMGRLNRADEFSELERRQRRSYTRFVTVATLISIVSILALPIPGVLKGIGVATTVLVLPLLLVFELDGRKSRR